MDNLRQTLADARADGTEVRGIAVINPGNPTGNILAEEQIKDIIQVKHRNTHGNPSARLLLAPCPANFLSHDANFLHGNTPRMPLSNPLHYVDGGGREDGGSGRRGVPGQHLEEGRFILVVQEGTHSLVSNHACFRSCAV